MTKYKIPKTITHNDITYIVHRESRIFDLVPIHGYGLYYVNTLWGFVAPSGERKWQAIRMKHYPVGQHPKEGDEFEVLLGLHDTIRDALHAILKR
jgi:hypothetical protein